ncbi:uncharacterized protein BJ171DRAFT_485714 [Polychytrium aggregatum]|uniref:uncharacterized protein n=1 Tax=Polychytrium aggregatum TaxID=110093 RepID=UPI0022FDF599|nr:uncharacterized protein BJ171DRAFT_485714 [Polychytrium aggregatum]KAI9209199.1 hypothetical protein BJ171DRAFT_485714 [Polychytrium aggregatum]
MSSFSQEEELVPFLSPESNPPVSHRLPLFASMDNQARPDISIDFGVSSSSQPKFAAPPQINQASFANEIPLPPAHNPAYEGMMNSLGGCLGFLGAIPCCVCFPNPYKTVRQGEVGLVTRFGKYYKTIDPGLHGINVCTERIDRVNIKIQIEQIPSQVIMTKDNVNISIDSVLYWHIVDPYTSVFLVNNVRVALIERTQTTLRHILGTRTLQDAIENREALAHQIEGIIREPAASWGVKIESILIKDLQFSKELQENLSAAAKAKRIGESKVIAAQAEVESAKLMREASDILNTPAAMQIRYLETLQAMSKTAGTKVIFMPAEPSAGHIGETGLQGATRNTLLELVADN